MLLAEVVRAIFLRFHVWVDFFEPCLGPDSASVTRDAGATRDASPWDTGLKVIPKSSQVIPKSSLSHPQIIAHLFATALPHPDYIVAPSEVRPANKTTHELFFCSVGGAL